MPDNSISPTILKIEELLKVGKPPVAIIAALGTNHHEISKVRKRLGFPCFKPGAPKGHRPQTIKRIALIRLLKIQGKSYSEIGDEFGFSHQRAQQLIAKKPRTDVCSACGRRSKSLHGHHEDYSKDETVPLCLRCHGKMRVFESAVFKAFLDMCAGRKSLSFEDITSLGISRDQFKTFCNYAGVERLLTPPFRFGGSRKEKAELFSCG